MKIDKNKHIDIQNNIEELREWVRKNKPSDIYNYQEIILNILRTVLNISFRKEIQMLREKLKMPIQCQHSRDDKESETIFKWIDKHSEAPQNPLDERIINLCKKYELNFNRYSEFVLNYIYFGSIIPFRPTLFDRLSKDESRYKARIIDNNDNKKLTNKIYIEFFKDTTKNGLREFINKNWDLIKILQKNLDESPSKHIYQGNTFKNHLDIYLLYLLGNKHSDIRDKIDKTYHVWIDEQNIRKIVSEMKNRIKDNCDKGFV